VFAQDHACIRAILYTQMNLSHVMHASHGRSWVRATRIHTQRERVSSPQRHICATQLHGLLENRTTQIECG
jgi:hypothetical protein